MKWFLIIVLIFVIMLIARAVSEQYKEKFDFYSNLKTFLQQLKINVSFRQEKIIDDDTFKQAQIMLEKNKKAPARAKAKEEMYLLSSKTFCGQCEFSVTGVSGTSRNGKIYRIRFF